MPAHDEPKVSDTIVAVLLQRQANALNKQLVTNVVGRVASIAIALFCVALTPITYVQLLSLSLIQIALSLVWSMDWWSSDKTIWQVEESLVRPSVEAALSDSRSEGPHIRRWEDAYITAVKPLALFKRPALRAEPIVWVFVTNAILVVSYLVRHFYR